MKITDAQIFTLRRMRNFAVFELRGDRASGRQVKRDIATRQRDDVNCRSLAPLMRAGLIAFCKEPTDMTRYYEVELTPEGMKLAKHEKTQQEGRSKDIG